jgi:hypothetical protein
VLLFAAATAANADFLDLTSITPGTAGSFSGTIDGIAVTGSITTPATSGGFVYDAVSGFSPWESTTIDNSSPQFSYCDVYSPCKAAADRVGYTSFSGTVNTATITINFASPLIDPIFQVANLDGMQYDFSPTAGLAGLALLSGNGGGGDGITINGDVIIADANPTTEIGQDPSSHPLMSGARSAYGSVELLGDFSTLTIQVSNPTAEGDGGSFTLATVPEPAGWLLLLTVAALLGWKMRAKAIADSAGRR